MKVSVTSFAPEPEALLHPEEQESEEEEEEVDDDTLADQEIPIMSGSPLTDRKSRAFWFSD